MSIIAIVHTTCGFLSLLLGAFIFLCKKATKRHILVGWLYCVAMIVMNLTAFGIYRVFGTFGVFHVFAIVSLLTVVAGLIAVLMKRRSKDWLSLHYELMAWSYAGLLAATSNEAFVHIGLLRQLTRVTSPWLPFVVMFGVLILSAIVIYRRKGPTLVRYGGKTYATDAIVK